MYLAFNKTKLLCQVLLIETNHCASSWFSDVRRKIRFLLCRGIVVDTQYPYSSFCVLPLRLSACAYKHECSLKTVEKFEKLFAPCSNKTYHVCLTSKSLWFVPILRRGCYSFRYKTVSIRIFNVLRSPSKPSCLIGQIIKRRLIASELSSKLKRMEVDEI